MLNIARELDSLNIKYEPQGDDKTKTLCPFHEDNNPSCILYTKTNRFKCYVCNACGDLTFFLSRVRNEKVHETRKYIQQRYGVNLDKTIAPSLIEECHLELFKHPELIKELHDRAVTDELISKYRLGYQNKRITIPITNHAGFYVSLRLYSPGAETNKFTSLKGYGGNFLFPPEQTKYDKIVIVGGEIKAIACAGVLNSKGYGVITGTTGEGKFLATWISELENKEVYVIMDVDEAGRKASKKLCHMVSNKVSNVYDIELPFQVPKGGPDDFIAGGGNLLEVIEKATQWEPDAQLIDSTPKKVSLSQAFSAKESGVRTEFKASVSCVGKSVYHVPKVICIECDKGQEECTLCTIVFPDTDNEFLVHPESQFIIETAGCSKASQVYAVRDALKIPKNCQVWKHEVKERYSVEDVRISSELSITERDVDREMQPAFIVKDEDNSAVLSNESYSFVGRTWPSPKNQEAISVVSNYNLEESALESYKCTDTEKLQVFQPTEWTVEGLRTKLNHIYEDFEANVTRIHQRREFHLVTDLTYYSPLFIQFDGRQENGWVSSLIVGDTSQGKSAVTKALMQHYKLGEFVECGNTSAAGILGGLNKIGGTHFLVWGVLAQHDKRIVTFDEFHVAPEELLGRMNDARSSGIVQITKIEKGRAKARTRTICIANPPRPGGMGTYNYGVDVIKDLLHGEQHIRRFDVCVVVDESDVDSEKLQTYRPVHNHIYTSDLSNELLLWAWTVKSVAYEDEAQILDLSVKLTAKYSETIPLVDKGSMRLKLAKLAAACAARTYSCVATNNPLEEGYGLYVRRCHVEFVYNFLDTMYSKPSFGYSDYSKHIRELDSLKDSVTVLKEINRLTYPRDFVDGTLRTNNIDITHIVDISGLDRQEATSFLGFLVRQRAIRRGGVGGRSYFKTREFTEKLKDWQKNGALAEKPEHIKERYGTL